MPKLVTVDDVRTALTERLGFSFARDILEHIIGKGRPGTLTGKPVLPDNRQQTDADEDWRFIVDQDYRTMALLVSQTLKLDWRPAQEVDEPYRARLSVKVRQAARQLAALAPARYRVMPPTPPAVVVVLPDGSTAAIQQHLSA